MTISFKVTKSEHDTILKIADRQRSIMAAMGVRLDDKITTVMDLCAVHANGCPLKLSDLLAADEANFAHDVFGIRRHINRDTGQLEDCFVPRYAQPAS